MEAHKSCSLLEKFKKISSHEVSVFGFYVQESSCYITKDIFSYNELELAAYVQITAFKKYSKQKHNKLFLFIFWGKMCGAKPLKCSLREVL